MLLDGLGASSDRARRWYFHLLARMFGLRVVVRGALAEASPRLLVCNHISYFDIVALGSEIEASFVAKAELRSWPFFGILARAARVVFIDRARSATRQASDQLQRRLDRGETLIMFPEATSSDGNSMKPFKSALFSVAERHACMNDGTERPVVVQPVSLAYTRINGLPMGVGWRSFVAWYGDMELPPHLWTLSQLGKITVEITLHPAVTIGEFSGRKALAAYCERSSREGFARLLAGREPAA
ncbi:MAG: lysophospholipid acyltransferase family protein [Rhizomicrobium sp.]